MLCISSRVIDKCNLILYGIWFHRCDFGLMRCCLSEESQFSCMLLLAQISHACILSSSALAFENTLNLISIPGQKKPILQCEHSCTKQSFLPSQNSIPFPPPLKHLRNGTFPNSSALQSHPGNCAFDITASHPCRENKVKQQHPLRRSSARTPFPAHGTRGRIIFFVFLYGADGVERSLDWKVVSIRALTGL